MQIPSLVDRAPLDNTSFAHRESIFKPENNTLIPHTLSIDWLNNKLYILFEVEVGVSERFRKSYLPYILYNDLTQLSIVIS